VRTGRKSVLYEGSDSQPISQGRGQASVPDACRLSGYRERFESEAQAAANLTHPNICRIYQYGCAGLLFSPGNEKETQYVCMQMLDGGSLDDRLDAPEHTTSSAVSNWLDVVADAIGDAHRNGVMHSRPQTHLHRV